MFGIFKRKEVIIEFTKKENIEFYLGRVIEIKLMLEDELLKRNLIPNMMRNEKEEKEINKILLNLNELLTKNYIKLLGNTTLKGD